MTDSEKLAHYDKLIIVLQNTKYFWNSIFVKTLKGYDLSKLEQEALKSYRDQLNEVLKETGQ